MECLCLCPCSSQIRHTLLSHVFLSHVLRCSRPEPLEFKPDRWLSAPSDDDKGTEVQGSLHKVTNVSECVA